MLDRAAHGGSIHRPQSHNVDRTMDASTPFAVRTRWDSLVPQGVECPVDVAFERRGWSRREGRDDAGTTLENTNREGCKTGLAEPI